VPCLQLTRGATARWPGGSKRAKTAGLTVIGVSHMNAQEKQSLNLLGSRSPNRTNPWRIVRMYRIIELEYPCKPGDGEQLSYLLALH